MRSGAERRVRAAVQDRGLSSAGRAPDLHSGGHRFDPGRLHQSRSFGHPGRGRAAARARSGRSSGRIIERSAQGAMRWIVRPDELTSLREIQMQHPRCTRVGVCHLEGLRAAGPGCCSKSSTLTKRALFGASRGKVRLPYPERLCLLWIGSSARRAFGGCLGSKRR